MNLRWHKTDYAHSRVLEVDPPHTLGEWVVIHPYNAGAGVAIVSKGPSYTAPPEIVAILRVAGMWRVISDASGFLIVTILEDFTPRWDRIEAEVIQAYTIAKEKADAANQQRD